MNPNINNLTKRKNKFLIFAALAFAIGAIFVAVSNIASIPAVPIIGTGTTAMAALTLGIVLGIKAIHLNLALKNKKDEAIKAEVMQALSKLAINPEQQYQTLLNSLGLTHAAYNMERGAICDGLSQASTSLALSVATGLLIGQRNAPTTSDQTNSDIAKGVIAAFFGTLTYAFQFGKDSLNDIIEEQREALMALNARLKLTDLLPPDFMNGLTERAKNNLASHASHELIKLVTHNILDAEAFAGLAAHHFATIAADKNIYQLLLQRLLNVTDFLRQDFATINRINSIAPSVLQQLKGVAPPDAFKTFVANMNEPQAKALGEALTIETVGRPEYGREAFNWLTQIREEGDVYYGQYLQSLRAILAPEAARLGLV